MCLLVPGVRSKSACYNTRYDYNCTWGSFVVTLRGSIVGKWPEAKSDDERRFEFCRCHNARGTKLLRSRVSHFCISNPRRIDPFRAPRGRPVVPICFPGCRNAVRFGTDVGTPEAHISLLQRKLNRRVSCIFFFPSEILRSFASERITLIPEK